MGFCSFWCNCSMMQKGHGFGQSQLRACLESFDEYGRLLSGPTFELSHSVPTRESNRYKLVSWIDPRPLKLGAFQYPQCQTAASLAANKASAS